MTEPSKSQHHSKARREDPSHGAARTQRRGAGGAAAAGRTAYRDEFERDYGPDPDEPLDRTESGHEF